MHVHKQEQNLKQTLSKTEKYQNSSPLDPNGFYQALSFPVSTDLD